MRRLVFEGLGFRFLVERLTTSYVEASVGQTILQSIALDHGLLHYITT